MSNVGKWDVWYKDLKVGMPTSYKYGETSTYQIGADFLADCETIEDWGVGGGGFLRFCPHAIGIDGSDTPFATKKHIDLCEYESSVEGIHMRHVLEHNYEWERIFANALNSATKKLCITLFIPFAEGATEELAHNLPHGVDVPDLAISKDIFDDILKIANPKLVEIETLDTDTGYNKEIVFKITF